MGPCVRETIRVQSKALLTYLDESREEYITSLASDKASRIVWTPLSEQTYHTVWEILRRDIAREFGAVPRPSE